MRFTPLLPALALAAACTPNRTPAERPTPAHSLYDTDPGSFAGVRPLTRAERTGFLETSRYADVLQFIDSLETMGARIHTGSIGKTTEGRDIPFIVASRPLVTNPVEARRLNRPIVYVQANIHAGEVEGKEALLAIVRDLVFNARPNVLDSLVLVAVPIYNADGNEKFAPQARNRSEQNGPELVGTRANAQGFDLNRDYIKAEAPETRASLAMFRAWDPDVFVDLHTTDGSYHGYALTYSPSLNPAALIAGPFTRDSILPVLRSRMRLQDGFEVFDYGNFASQDSAAKGWFTYDARPRYGTNYYGLRGRISILSEAFSHDPFARRVASTYDYVAQILSFVAENPNRITDLSHSADAQTTSWGTRAPVAPRLIPIRSRMTTTPYTGEVLVEKIVRTDDTVRTEPGVRRGWRRTGIIESVRMPVYDRFEPALSRPMPYGYAFSGEVSDTLLSLLALHGVQVDRLDAPATADAQAFTVDSVLHSRRTFQGHQEASFAGTWQPVRPQQLREGTYVVRTGQPLGVLAMYVLEPESDDGFATWNAIDSLVSAGAVFPVVRILQPLSAPLSPVR